jgi:hypothetical protein
VLFPSPAPHSSFFIPKITGGCERGWGGGGGGGALQPPDPLVATTLFVRNQNSMNIYLHYSILIVAV